MLVRSALFLALLASGVASSARAAPFDDLKGYLASCLRFEMDGTRARRDLTLASRTHLALDRCGEEVGRLERADGRRLRGDGGLSPSTKAVILTVLGRGGAGRDGIAPVRY